QGSYVLRFLHSFPTRWSSDLITMISLHFNGVSQVMFNDEEAEIVSNTQTEVKVKIPPSAFGVVHVTTPSGTASSPNTFGFKHLVDRKSTRLNSSHVKISYSVF